MKIFLAAVLSPHVRRRSRWRAFIWTCERARFTPDDQGLEFDSLDAAEYEEARAAEIGRDRLGRKIPSFVRFVDKAAVGIHVMGFDPSTYTAAAVSK
jgi:hypothetical protein